MSMMDEIQGVQKRKLLFLNIACLLIIAYFTVLTCRQIIYATPVYDNDYKTFYISLRKPLDVYSEHFYVRVLAYANVKENEITTTNAKTSPTLSAVNMNTPTMCFILKGLVNISNSLSVNALAWSFSALFCAALSLYVLLRLFKTLSLWYYLPLLLLLFLSWPSLSALKLGQVSYFILPFFSIAFLLVNLKHWRSAAVVFALLASLKLFFLIFFLFFVAKRNWRLSLLFVGSFLFFFFLPVIYFHWAVYHDFFRMAQNEYLVVSHSTFPMNGSLLGVVARLVTVFNLPSYMPQLRLSIIILSLYVLIRWLIYDYYFLRSLPEFSDELRVSFLIVLGLLLSPLAWIYYFLFLLIPVVVFFKISARYALSKTFFIFFILALALPYFAWMSSVYKTVWYVQNFSSAASLVCWLICVFSAANSVCRANPPLKKNREILFAILCLTVLLNVILLHLNYGMPYFLDLNKKNYIQNTMPAISIRKDDMTKMLMIKPGEK
ncbi:MAG: hypothetical protein A3F13_02285 [Gammaproteobacteria bacterium RIFCSPHIGHO2_12_FULL_40_19]|nr:MAG: hypothetical protein A3F13_02285 [Gammaproteobacteria bacterium RIFCSPHIGHO2_12_FULL_40_19]